MKNRNLFLALPLILFACLITLSGWQSGPAAKDSQDTTKKSNKKGASYSKKTIITFDENGEPHEQVFEDFEGDERLRRLVIPGRDFDVTIPDMPDFEDFAIPGFPHNFHFNMPDFQFDSLPGFSFDDDDFEGFGEEMEARMKERFEAFGPQLEERMKLLEEQLQSMEGALNFQEEGMRKNWEKQLERLGTLEGLDDLDLNLDDIENLEEFDRLKDWDGMQESLENVDRNLNSMRENIKAFEEDAQQELVRDGYLEAGESVESIEWTDDTIKFNGKPIKPEHFEKYRQLKEKHVKQQWRRGRPE